ncbi:hypothetical protein JOE40_000443 [Arthrobacter sp. PvP102]|nr:hypothetical protein [Arthrobacter sp. PvP102]
MVEIATAGAHRKVGPRLCVHARFCERALA